MFFCVSCTNCNPNDDPDMGNTPRVDPQTMQGYLTDVSAKRHIRDCVDTVVRAHRAGPSPRGSVY